MKARTGEIEALLQPPARLGRDDLLALDTFVVHRGQPHLRIRDGEPCRRCARRECTTVCPAENYRLEADGRVSLQWEGCLECGACRVACPHRNVAWEYPAGGYGVHYRYG